MASVIKSQSGMSRRQSTWIRNEDRLKNWRKVSTNQAIKLDTKTNDSSSLDKKSGSTRSGGPLTERTINSASTGSSSQELNLQRLQSVDEVEQRESIEKCLKWMETLPKKFSGMHIFAPASGGDDSLS